MSMKTKWDDKSVTAPVSLIITGFSPVQDSRKTLTPELKTDEDTVLVIIDIAEGKNRLAGSALAQVYNQLGDEAPDINPNRLADYFNDLLSLKEDGKIL